VPDTLEDVVRRLTVPVGGQYPRPWATDLLDPSSARVFIVGRNQATSITVEDAGGHDKYLDALFNRRGLSCRTLYERARHGKGPSRTRANIDSLTARMKAAGSMAVLETNVCCYSTPMSADLRRTEHAAGRARGREIFVALMRHVRPSIVIAHGAGTIRELSKVLGAALPRPPAQGGAPVVAKVRGDFHCSAIVIPSLAPPGWNRWSAWAPRHLDAVAETAIELLLGI
jgi:hypothetical protein